MATIHLGLNVVASSRMIAKENVKSALRALGGDMRYVFKVALLQQGASVHVFWLR